MKHLFISRTDFSQIGFSKTCFSPKLFFQNCSWGLVSLQTHGGPYSTVCLIAFQLLPRVGVPTNHKLHAVSVSMFPRWSNRQPWLFSTLSGEKHSLHHLTGQAAMVHVCSERDYFYLWWRQHESCQSVVRQLLAVAQECCVGLLRLQCRQLLFVMLCN